MEDIESMEKSIRHYTAQAAGFKSHKKAREAAFKAWNTMRMRSMEQASKNTQKLDTFNPEILVSKNVSFSTYLMHGALIKESKLTTEDKGGIGKDLSDGWAANYAIGCTHGCKFCYVDAIHKKFGFNRAGSIVYNNWGDYFAVPSNINEIIEDTKWAKWKGKEVMLSSMHDPYLPQLFKWTRKILEKALPEGVKFCIQTRSPLVEKDMDLIKDFKEQIRLQISVATLNQELSKAIEPRVVSPERRLLILEKAKNSSINTGIIIAPVFPSINLRKYVYADLKAMALRLSMIKPEHIYGESIHLRGVNLAYIEDALKQTININGFDEIAERYFYKALEQYNLKGTWWVEHKKYY